MFDVALSLYCPISSPINDKAVYTLQDYQTNSSIINELTFLHHSGLFHNYPVIHLDKFRLICV